MEKIINLFERLVVALEKMAAAAAAAPVAETSTPPAAEAKAPKAPKAPKTPKKEEAAATSHAVPSIDPQGDDFGGPAETTEDDFGGAEEQAATATRDEALAAIRDLALRKGRDTAATLLKQVSGCEKTSEIEKMPNAAQIFGAIVVSAAKLV